MSKSPLTRFEFVRIFIKCSDTNLFHHSSIPEDITALSLWCINVGTYPRNVSAKYFIIKIFFPIHNFLTNFCLKISSHSLIFASWSMIAVFYTAHVSLMQPFRSKNQQNFFGSIVLVVVASLWSIFCTASYTGLSQSLELL